MESKTSVLRRNWEMSYSQANTALSYDFLLWGETNL